MLQSTDTTDHYWLKKKKDPTADSLSIVHVFTKAKNLLWSCICVSF